MIPRARHITFVLAFCRLPTFYLLSLAMMAPPPADLDDELAFLETATPAEQDTDGNLLHHQLVTSPLFTYSALKSRPTDFPSRGLLGTSAGDRVYINTNAPSSAVICGVQVGLFRRRCALFLIPQSIFRGPAKAIPSLAFSNLRLSRIHVLASSRNL